jgi:polyhydroxybutyrate depolymerase
MAAFIVAPLIGVATTGPVSPAGAAPPMSSAGCATTTLRNATLSLSVGGFTRTVIVHRPKSLDSTPLSLVLNLHGSGSTALEQEEFTDMNSTANVDGFIVAYPQALIPDGSGFDWNVPNVPLVGGRTVPAHAANDITFLTSLVKILENKYCIDPARVYATGFSGGAREVSQLACDDSTLFAAVAPVSGIRRPLPCATKRAVPVLSFHGSADPVDPFNGHGQKYWTYSVATGAKDWASQDDCQSAKTSSPSKNVKLTVYGACANGATVKLYEIKGEGHEWPGGPPLPAALTSVLGPQSTALDANSVMWSFFENYKL